MVKPQPKMTKLVVSAIRNLRDVQGSTAKDILNYVMRECSSEPSMERKAALKRGLEYGILKRTHGHYMLNTDSEMLADSGPMERARSRRRRRRRRGRGGKSKSAARRGRGRKRRRRRGGRRKSRGKSRGGRRGRRGRSRRGKRGGRRMKSHGNVDDIDMLIKEPVESARTGVEVTGADFERPRSRSRSRNSRSRSRTPSHSRSSLSSDREGGDGNREAD